LWRSTGETPVVRNRGTGGTPVVRPMTAEQVKILEKLANGIIPADEMDEGAAVVNAGMRIAERVDQGINAKVYLAGMEFLQGRNVLGMNDEQIHELLGVIREKVPGFFKQLRMDVSALYLSDAGVWGRIGFGGPSSESGGHPDFDQRQTKTHGRGAHAT
jgi:hypothetical protein